MSKSEIEARIETIEEMIQEEAISLYVESGEFCNDRIKDLECRKMTLEAMLREAD